MPELALEPGSGAERIALHLKKNADTVLDRHDVARLLTVAIGAVDKLLQPGVDAGVITIAHDGDRGRVWRAGPRLKTWDGAAVAVPANKPKDARGGRRERLPVLDLAKFPVQTGVVPPKPDMSRRGETRHDDMFDSMSADGMCRTGLPASHRASVTKASQAYLKARPAVAAKSAFIFRALAGDTFGIWRVARTDPAAAEAPATKAAARKAA